MVAVEFKGYHNGINTQTWDYILYPSSGIRNIKKQAFSGNWIFASSGEGRETPPLLFLLKMTSVRSSD
jgi:hypothetical protein